MAKEMRKICAGTVRNRDKTWFSELSDKGVCVVIWKYKFTVFCHLARTTKVHLYCCMKNCDGDLDVPTICMRTYLKSRAFDPLAHLINVVELAANQIRMT